MLMLKEVGQRDIDYANNLIHKLNINRARRLHIDVDKNGYEIYIKQHEIMFCRFSIGKIKVGENLEHYILIDYLIDKPVSRKALLNLFANTFSKYFYAVILAHNVTTDLLTYKKDYKDIPKVFTKYINKIINEGDDIDA